MNRIAGWLLLPLLVAAGCRPPPASESLWPEEAAWSRIEEGWARLVPLAGRRPLVATRGGGELRAVAFPSGGTGRLSFRVGGEVSELEIDGPTPIRLPFGGAREATLEGKSVSLLAPRIVHRERDGPRRLLVVADTLRYDHATPELMPEVLDYFRSGVEFERAYSTSSWTLPSLASIFTGKRPTELRLADGTLISLAEGEPTLASDLGRRGYRSVAVTANYTVNHENGYSNGFDLFYVPSVRGEGGIPDAAWVVERALEASAWLSDEPVFLFVQPMEAHEPYRDHERGVVLNAPAPGPESGAEIGTEVDAEKLAALRQAYRSEVRYLSRQLGRLFAELGETELAVFTSDHGEELYEHRGFRHGPTLYPEVVHVPLLVRAPNLAGGPVREAVSLLGLRSLFAAGDTRPLLEAGWPVTLDTFSHAPPRFSLVTGTEQTVLFARDLEPQPSSDPLGRFLLANHPRQIVIPHRGEPSSEPPTAAAWPALAAHFAGFRRGCWVALESGEGSNRLELRIAGVESAGWLWGRSGTVVLRPGAAVRITIESPEPALVFLPARGEEGAIEIESTGGQPLRIVESWAEAWSEPGASAWIDPGRPPAEIRGLEATLERLRALGYI